MELYQALITLDGWTFLAQICNLMIQLLIFKKFLLKSGQKGDRRAQGQRRTARSQMRRSCARRLRP